MSKKKNYDVKRSKAFINVNKALTKKGKIKGTNKKETKTLRELCTHHKRGKDGSIKLAIKPLRGAETPTCVCKLCGAKFPMVYSLPEENLDNLMDEVKDVNNLVKFLAMACRMDPETVDYFAKFGVELKGWKKLAKRTFKVSSKHDRIDKKKKSRNNRTLYGHWETK